MKRIAITVTVILLLGIATLYFHLEGKLVYEEEVEAPHITGNIYEITEEGIIVAEGVEGEGMFVGKAIWLSINEETRILNDEKKEITFQELTLNQKVSAWVTGPVAESYPERGTAKLIIIEKGDLLASCYIGGCSRELCTKDKEMISTCEFLPGMECLGEEMSCELVEGECAWVLSVEAANCFAQVEKAEGVGVRESRIGYLFEKAEKLLE